MFGQREKRTIIDDKLDDVWDRSIIFKLIVVVVVLWLFGQPILNMAKDSLHLNDIKAHFSEHYMSICPQQPGMTTESCTALEKQHNYICSNGAMGNGKVDETEYYVTCLMQQNEPKWVYPK